MNRRLSDIQKNKLVIKSYKMAVRPQFLKGCLLPFLYFGKLFVRCFIKLNKIEFMSMYWIIFIGFVAIELAGVIPPSGQV